MESYGKVIMQMDRVREVKLTQARGGDETSTPPTTVVPTMGRSAAESVIVEQVSGGRLLIWQDGEETLSTELSVGDVTYVPEVFSLSYERMLHLPAGSAAYGSAGVLLGEVAAAVGDSSELGSSDAMLVAAFVLATWVVEALPEPLCLNLFGREGSCESLMQTVSCLCRRPVSLVSTNIRELAALPSDITPTFLLHQPTEFALKNLLSLLSAERDVVLSGGRCLLLRGSVVARTRRVLSAPVLPVRATAGKRYRRLTEAAASKLRDYFQPRLLRFRLEHLVSVAGSQFDAPQFNAKTRVVARALGSALEGYADLREHLLRALDDLNEQTQVELSQEPAAVVAEALLAICHEHKAAAQVGEIAALANAIFLGRGVEITMTDRGVGEILRSEFGLTARRQGAGYRVLISPIRAQLHEFASSYGVLTLLETRGRCELCAEVAPMENLADPTMTNGMPDNAYEDVHDVHDVHDLHCPQGESVVVERSE